MNYIKLAILEIISFIFAITLGFSITNSIQNISLITNFANNLDTIILIIFSLTGLITFSSLIAGITRLKNNNRDKNINIYILIGLGSIIYLGYLIPFILLFIKSHTSIILFLCIAIFVLLAYLASLVRFVYEMESTIKLKLGGLSSKSFDLFILALSLSSTILFYTNHTKLKIVDVLTDDLFNQIATPTANIVEPKINETINEQLLQYKVSLNALNDKSIAQLSDTITLEIAKQFDVNVKDTNFKIVYNSKSKTFQATGTRSLIGPFIKSTAIKATLPYEKYLPFIITILFYGTIIFIFYIAKLILGPISLIISWLLIETKFFDKQKETVEVERLTI